MSTCTICNKQIFREYLADPTKVYDDLCEECEDIHNWIVAEYEDKCPQTLEEYLNEECSRINT